MIKKRKMSKNAMPIEWHETNLVNRKASLEAIQRQIDKLEANKKRCVEEITFLEEQIQTAKKQKKIEFDSEKYLIKKKDKCENSI